jgi:HSP20 family molecular chaperone IbpA
MKKINIMKNILSALVLVVLSATSFAQNTKNVVYDANAEVRKVDEFKAIDVSNAITVYLSQGAETAVAVSAENGDKNKVKTEVKNGVLKIYMESDFWGKWGGRDEKVKAYVTVKDIEKLVASGASHIRIAEKLTAAHLKVVCSGASSIKGEIKAEDIKFDLTGASSTNLTINTNKLNVDISGASSGNFSGTTGEMIIDASGASSFKGFDLAANTCIADASGASTIRVNVSKEFSKIHASGASSIHYKGEATIKNFESSGASSIKKDSGK